MQDIDKTINRLCAHIQTELVLRKPKSLKQMPELVTALAQLVEARAKLEATRPKVQDETDIDYIIRAFTKKLQQTLKGGENHEINTKKSPAGCRADTARNGG